MTTVFPEEISSLCARLVDRLTVNSLKIAFAESCTAGLLSGALCSVSGASAVYDGGLVCYANAIKNKCLGVSADVLNSVGAVSAECAEQMAKGAKTLFDADIALSITGIAGPSGGTPQKPVGTVYIGCAFGAFSLTALLHLDGDRNAVRTASVKRALEIALRCVNLLAQSKNK